MSRCAGALLVVITVAACHGGPLPPSDSRTVVVGAVPSSAPAAPAPIADRLAPQAAPLVSIGRDELCKRIGSQLHCVRDLVPERPISASPPVAGLDDVIDVAHGTEFACAVTGRGEVKCWGNNAKAQLGAGVRDTKLDTPTLVRGVHGARRVFAGESHACAIVEHGAVVCWGDNEVGQTGSATRYLPTAREHSLATPVSGIRDAELLALTREGTCALTPVRAGFCWGRSPFDPSLDPDMNTQPPGATSKLEGFDDLDAKSGELCGVRHDVVICTHGDRALTGSIRSAKRVRVASHHGCALLRDATVSCWGTNYDGVLGHSTFDRRKYDAEPAATVPGVASAVDLFVGDRMSCAMTADGRMWCWGTFPTTAQDNGMRLQRAPVLMAR